MDYEHYMRAFVLNRAEEDEPAEGLGARALLLSRLGAQLQEVAEQVVANVAAFYDAVEAGADSVDVDWSPLPDLIALGYRLASAFGFHRVDAAVEGKLTAGSNTFI